MDINSKIKKIRVGIIFGGKSMEHEISLMSATSIINAIDKDKFEIVLIGITKEGQWLKYNGPVELIESSKWEEIAREEHSKNSFSKMELISNKQSLKVVDGKVSVLGYSGASLKDDVDVVFPVLHGPFGEDGTIQGLFEMINIPYAGCGVLASAVSMDKAISKEIFQKAGLPICKYLLVLKEEMEDDIHAIIAKIEVELAYPLFVKPSNMGSSVGISKATNTNELLEALAQAARHDRRIVVEEGVFARELEVGIVGNYRPKASIVGEIIPSKEFYDYEAKYFDGGKSKMSIPADISEVLSKEIREMAVRAYEAIDGTGFARIDFFLDKENRKVYLNEINTIPGFTKFSMFPQLWEQTGVPYKDTIEKIIQLAFERFNTRKQL